MEQSSTTIGKMIISGYKGDYIFETIEQGGNFYEAETLETWACALENDTVILDIGANLGNHSLFWAQRMPGARLYAFEPYQENFDCLVKNITNNQLSERIQAVNLGVSERSGFAEVKEYDIHNLGATTYGLVETPGPQSVKMISVDDFVEQNAIHSIGFVKIDTEGFELPVLKGMTETIRKHSPTLWVEVSYDSHLEVQQLLEECGYRLADVRGFNHLYVPSGSAVFFETFNEQTLLDEMLKYLEKTNAYYKAYNTAKGWLTERNNMLEQVTHERDETRAHLDAANNEYRESTANYANVKHQLDEATQAKAALQNKRQELEGALSSMNEKIRMLTDANDAYVGKLLEYADSNQEQISLLTEIKSNLNRLQAQNAYLKNENTNYKQKLAKITNTWYGRFALRSYKLMKKVKATIARSK